MLRAGVVRNEGALLGHAELLEVGLLGGLLRARQPGSPFGAERLASRHVLGLGGAAPDLFCLGRAVRARPGQVPVVLRDLLQGERLHRGGQRRP